MRRLRLITLAAALAASAAAAQAVPAPLRLCADPQNLPFSSNAAGAPGLYVEIGQAVAQTLGRPMETVWSQSIFGKRNLRTTLLAGQCDFAVGLPATSDFMGPRLAFTRPILELGYALVSRKGAGLKSLDDLKAKRVLVQFASPPQSLLALRSDVTTLTAMDPEEAMRRLAAGEADAAFVWGPSAGWINHAQLADAFDVVAVETPGTQLQWPTAIGFSGKQQALRDEVDAALPALAPRIRELSLKYAVAAGPAAATLTDAGPQRAVVVAEAPAGAGKGNAAAGREIFDGTCAHCHGPNAVVADRKINLRLLKRKYGDEMESVFLTTVIDGRPTKGMPTWKDVFKHQDFVNILSYLKTVQEP
jgi:polar amino acid transport system substrate-binding protein